MKDIMLDIETLGAKANSVILQISMIYFDRYTKEMSKSFCKNIDIEDSIKNGFITTESTLKWWEGKPEEVWKSVSENGESVKDVLKEVARFIKYGSIIWCHNNFDIPLLANAFDLMNMTIPWKYTNTRDIRTLTDLSNVDLKQYDWKTEKTHNSLDDCKFQINYVVDCINKINEGLKNGTGNIL